MEDLGPQPGGGGRRLAVHSRVITKAGPEMFDSTIVIDSGGRVKIES